MCVIKDNSIGLLDFVFDLNWKPSSGVMFYRKKKKKKQQHNILNKKNQKKGLCLIVGQNKKKEPLPISFHKLVVQAQTLLFEFSNSAISNKATVKHP